MKLVWTLCLITTFQAFALKGYTQNAMVNIHMENAKVENILKEIEKQSDYRFFYDANSIKFTDVADVTWNSVKVSDALAELFNQKGIAYRLIDKQIVLFPTSMLETTAAAQGITVRGTVTDNGQPLPGVNVVVKGTTIGVVTDVNGRYTIRVPNDKAVLQFTFVGYTPQEAEVGARTTIDTSMAEDTRQIEEVVVVGYGVQKKVNLTGAVDRVTSETFENRPITNISQGLVGAVPNLNIQMLNGKPTHSPSFNIRGITSISTGVNDKEPSALVLIDGVEGDPRMLNPNDIESISVLKDAASSSIYGARAVFGVVLITTKSASKGKTSITYSANFSTLTPTEVPDNICDSYPWAQGFNDAWARWNDNGNYPTAINKTMPFSQAYLAEIKRRWEDPSLPRIEINPANNEYQYYYSTDWYDELYKDRIFAQDHNISLSGGNDVATFYVTGRYNGQEGLFTYNSNDYAMYNLRAKGTIQLTKWLQIENNGEYSLMTYHQPVNVGEGSSVWRNIEDEGHPLAPMFNPDGTMSFSASYTVGDHWYGKNALDSRQRVFKNKTAAKAEFFDKSLTIRADFTFQNTDIGSQRTRIPVPYSRYKDVIGYTGTNRNDFQERRQSTEYYAANVYANYVKSFNQIHNFNFLLGFNYEQSLYRNVTTTRNDVVFADAKDIFLAVGPDVLTEGGYDKWKTDGVFFRVNYNFKERYLLELNGRYDGSSKFPEGQQYAFFPSASAGWRVSEESFWNVNPSILSNVKVRASYGSMGNGSIKSYMFYDKHKIEQSGRVINNVRPQKTGQPPVVSPDLTWESAFMGNVGLDFATLNNRLTFSGDFYRRWTTEMITVGPSLPVIYGIEVPKGNFADVKTTGWEISINWADRLQLAGKPFGYNFRFTLSDYSSVITKYNNDDMNLLTSDNKDEYYVGKKVGEIWGYQVEGLFRTTEEIAASPSQSNLMNTNTRKNYVGDLKFKNLDGDNVIYHDLNRANASGDKRVIGNTTPRYSYSFSLGGDWNGFFMSAFFQGVMKQDWYPSGESRFWGQYNRPYNDYPRWQESRMYRDELQNFDAYLPRLVGYTAQSNRALGTPNDRYLQKVSYIRLRNLQVGYTLPKALVSKFYANDVRIYLSGENLWCWSPLYKITRDTDVSNIYGSENLTNDDKGTDGDGLNFPLMRSVSVGLSINF